MEYTSHMRNNQNYQGKSFKKTSRWIPTSQVSKVQLSPFPPPNTKKNCLPLKLSLRPKFSLSLGAMFLNIRSKLSPGIWSYYRRQAEEHQLPIVQLILGQIPRRCGAIRSLLLFSWLAFLLTWLVLHT